MIYGYLRVSTKDQSLERQRIAINDYCNSKGIDLKAITIFQDKLSGKNLDRPQYRALRNSIRKGDTLIIKELDRLGRNKEDIKNELDYYRSIGVKINILNIPTTLIDLPTGQEWVFDMINNILIEVLGAIAEEERVKLKQRQLEGINAMPVNENGKKYSSRTGKEFGRTKVEKDTLPKDFIKVYRKLIKKNTNGSLTTEEGAKILGVSRMTLYRYIKIYESEVN